MQAYGRVYFPCLWMLIPHVLTIHVVP